MCVSAERALTVVPCAKAKHWAAIRLGEHDMLLYLYSLQSRSPFRHTGRAQIVPYAIFQVGLVFTTVLGDRNISSNATGQVPMMWSELNLSGVTPHIECYHKVVIGAPCVLATASLHSSATVPGWLLMGPPSTWPIAPGRPIQIARVSHTGASGLLLGNRKLGNAGHRPMYVH
jgi:hypothetical protein